MSDDHSRFETLVAFVEGKIEPGEFQQYLYDDPDVEAILSDDPQLKRDNYAWPSTYLFAIERNLNEPAGLLNIQGAVSDWLERHGVAHSIDPAPTEMSDLIWRAQPKWLDVDTKFLAEAILPHAGSRSGRDLETWLRAEFKRRFRCVSRPPRWIQSPRWPIRDGEPLVFLGQLELPDYFHDEGAAYVFHDARSGEYEVVTQVA